MCYLFSVALDNAWEAEFSATHEWEVPSELFFSSALIWTLSCNHGLVCFSLYLSKYLFDIFEAPVNMHKDL